MIRDKSAVVAKELVEVLMARVDALVKEVAVNTKKLMDQVCKPHSHNQL